MTTMTTYTQKCFDPMQIQEDDIDIRDIAHALSLICRGNGHIPYFYSVGQHSINAFLEARERNHPKNVQLACLLHDASEAYLNDCIRPIKMHLPDYQAIEKNILHTIFSKYKIQLTKEEQIQVKAIDNALLQYDLNHLYQETSYDLKTRPDISEKNYRDVEQQFLTFFNEIRN